VTSLQHRNHRNIIIDALRSVLLIYKNCFHNHLFYQLNAANVPEIFLFPHLCTNISLNRIIFSKNTMKQNRCFNGKFLLQFKQGKSDSPGQAVIDFLYWQIGSHAGTMAYGDFFFHVFGEM